MVLVGHIVRPHHNRGEVSVVPETDFAETRFAVGRTVWAQGGAVKAPKELTITAFRMHDGRPIVGFEGFDGINAAETLRGCELRVPDDTLPELAAGQYWLHDLIGCAVETTAGVPVGLVRRVDDGAAPLLVVDPGDVLIPMVDSICRSIDITAKKIVIEPLDGLLTVNEK